MAAAQPVIDVSYDSLDIVSVFHWRDEERYEPSFADVRCHILKRCGWLDSLGFGLCVEISLARDGMVKGGYWKERYGGSSFDQGATIAAVLPHGILGFLGEFSRIATIAGITIAAIELLSVD